MPSNNVILPAFYPIVLMVSHKFSIHFHPIKDVGHSWADYILSSDRFTTYALQCQFSITKAGYLGISILQPSPILPDSLKQISLFGGLVFDHAPQ